MSSSLLAIPPTFRERLSIVACLKILCPALARFSPENDGHPKDVDLCQKLGRSSVERSLQAAQQPYGHAAKQSGGLPRPRPALYGRPICDSDWS